MSMLARLTAMGGASPQTYVDDVFSTYLYTGNGSTQTITNGIDLAGKGGLVWAKLRSGPDSPLGHRLVDTVRGLNYVLATDSTNAQSNVSGYVNSVSTTGYVAGTSQANLSGDNYVSWTFRKAPKFFDVVTYTGNGAVGGNNFQTINHSLGVTPGMIVVKATSASGTNWVVWHRSLTNTYYIVRLNTTDAQVNIPCIDAVSSTSFNANNQTTNPAADALNNTGVQYVAYLFAHDTATDGIIQCGSFTTDGSGNATVNLGWEPQFATIKASSTTGQWYMQDSARGGLVAQGATGSPTLFANLSNAEANAIAVTATATGFTFQNSGVSSTTFIYLAIRRPNKPPTLGTQVYNAIARTGTGAAATVTGVGFVPDAVIPCHRAAAYKTFGSRLQGNGALIQTNLNGAEITGVQSPLWDSSYGTIGVGADTGVMNFNGTDYINYFLKRAPGVFDVVCYRGNGANPRSLEHALGTPVEFGLIKARINSAVCNSWTVKVSNGANKGRTNSSFNLESSFGYSGWATNWNDPSSTDSVFYVNASGDSSGENNTNGTTYVAYLFATKAGISKVGSYTGNGSSQTINAGFTTGARFILIKRADSTGDWYVWDSTRGIVAGNDPHISLNDASAEVTTDDSIDPDTSGFIVNQLAATNINVNAATYIYLSFA